MEAGVSDVFYDAFCSVQTSGVVDVHQGRQGVTNDFFVQCWSPSAVSSCLPLSATLTQRRSEGSLWWSDRRSPAGLCSVVPF